MKFPYRIIALAIVILGLSSCLTVEYKIYEFHINKDGSGKLILTYDNILSVPEDTIDYSEKDYDILIDQYYIGDKIEKFYSKADSISKRLYVEGSKLNGEVIVWFDSISDVKLCKTGKRGQYMMCLAVTSEKERYISSNGVYQGCDVPVVLWKGNTKVLKLKTAVKESDRNAKSLLSIYKKKFESSVSEEL